jgi:two-component system NtrC family sensor kinase
MTPERNDERLSRVRPLVLVVDDSATYRAALGHRLTQAGYDVATAANGEQGLRTASRLRPDLLVVDRVLPDLDGTAVIRNVRLDAALRRTPCLLVTADDDPAVEFTALETGADAYVRKGDDLSVLLARVAALCRDLPVQRETATSRTRRIAVVAPSGTGAFGDMLALPADEYQVVSCCDVEQAISELDRGGDCVIVAAADRTDSAEAVSRIRASRPGSHTPILVVQSADDHGDAAVILSTGADDYVSTADGAALFVARLRALLRRKEAEQEERRIAESLLRHEAETSAAQMRAEAAERESEFKERFLAMMSHELRTPLNAILGFTQLLERGVGGALTDSQRRHVAGVVRSADHLLALVNDVLDLTKIRAGKLPLRRAAVHVADVVDTARVTIESTATQREIALLMDVPHQLPPVFADPVRLQQVLQNLLSNAVKFTPVGGTVIVNAAAEGAFVKISVRDTGVGIREEDFPRLFRDFERLEHSQSQQVDGTGLGLALTKHFVELHGGRIDVSSQVNVGSLFTVWLPVVEEVRV